MLTSLICWSMVLIFLVGQDEFKDGDEVLDQMPDISIEQVEMDKAITAKI